MNIKNISAIIFVIIAIALIISNNAFAQDYKIEETKILTEPTPGLYDKFEIGIKLSESLNDVINLNYAKYGDVIDTYGFNPFDPEHISIEATFWHEDGNLGHEEYTVNGFYYKEFIRNFDNLTNYSPLPDSQPWQEIGGVDFLKWRIRFSPNKVGTWYYKVTLKTSGIVDVITGEIIGAPIIYVYENNLSFNCINSSTPGPLEFSSNRKYLQFEKNKTPFFGTALSIGDGGGSGMFEYGLDNMADTNYNVGRLKAFNENMEFYLSTFAANGGNLSKIHMDHTSYQLEHEVLGNYYSRLPVAWELDQIVDRCAELGLYLIIVPQVHHGFYFDYDCDSSKWMEYLIKFGWDENPYNDINIGVDENNKDEFFSSDIAKKYFKNRLRYFVARWGYAYNLLGVEIATEINNMMKYCDDSEGYLYAMNKDFENDNTPEAIKMRADVKSWLSEMIEYSKSLDNNHEMIFSGSHGGLPTECYDEKYEDHIYSIKDLDFIGLHKYGAGEHLHRVRFELLKKLENKREYNGKVFPVVFTEMGTDKIINVTNDELHKACWTTALAGSFSNGFNYYWDRILSKPVWVNTFRNISLFMQDVPVNAEIGFNSYLLRNAPVVGQIDQFNNNDTLIDQYHLISKDGNLLLGFVHATKAYWGFRDSIVGTDTFSVIISYPLIAFYEHPVNVQQLNPGERYEVIIYDTHGDDEDPLSIIDSYYDVADEQGIITFQLDFKGSYKSYAYKISRACHWSWTGLNSEVSNATNDLVVSHNTQQVFYQTLEGNIESISFKDGEWFWSDLDEATSNVVVEGDLTISKNSTQVFFITNNRINSIYKQDDIWKWSGLNSVATDVEGDLVITNSDEIFYRSTDKRIRGIYFDRGIWYQMNLTHLPNNVDGGLSVNRYSNQIFYRTTDKKINSIWLNQGNWEWSGLNYVTNNVIVDGDVLASTCSNEVFFVTNDRKMKSIDYQSSQWVLSDMNNVTQDVNISGELVMGGYQLQIFFKTDSYKLNSVYYMDNRWNWSGLDRAAQNVESGLGMSSTSTDHVFYISDNNKVNGIYWDCSVLHKDDSQLKSNESNNPYYPENLLDNAIVYPNPTQSKINFKNVPVGTEISIYSFDGTLVYKCKFDGDMIQLPKDLVGIYTIKMVHKEAFVYRKIVIV